MSRPWSAIVRVHAVLLLSTVIRSYCRGGAFVRSSVIGWRGRHRGSPAEWHHRGDPSTNPKTRPLALQSSSQKSLLSFSTIGIESSSGANEDDDAARAFLEHMFRDRGCEGEPGDVAVRRDESSGRRGLYVAAEDGIASGDYVFAVPAEAAWVVETGDEWKDNKELSDAERGLRFLMWQRGRSSTDGKSAWKPYADTLPTREAAFDPTPDFWSGEQIAALELPPIVERAFSRKQEVRALAEKLAFDAELPIPSEEDLRFATWVVNSRAVTVLNEDGDGDGDDETDFDLTATCVLVPLLDMINHSSDHPNAHFAVLGDGGADGESLYYAAVADRDLRQGEEILISYGTEEESSAELLLRYGFVPNANSYDMDFWESFLGDENGDDDPSFWSMTLQEDEDRLKELENGGGGSVAIDRTILRFRIRMKRAYAEWRALLE